MLESVPASTVGDVGCDGDAETATDVAGDGLACGLNDGPELEVTTVVGLGDADGTAMPAGTNPDPIDDVGPS